MVNKTIKRGLTWLLCLALTLGTVPVTQAQAETGRAITITTKDAFLDFAERCRLDSYSQGLTVTLAADIDLRDTDFMGIPTFGGSFDGNHHSITGLSITADGSAQGLFRYLRSGAQIRDLTVEGTVSPGGSRDDVGGIVGHNLGLVENCKFDGLVSGGDQVGGIAGRNGLGGIISGCRVFGNVVGDHFAGGLVGNNAGVIRDCSNTAQVNTTEVQNQVDISQVTLDTLTGTETVAAVTDIGGIAGGSSGVIRSCENRGNVGYRHMGYNVGGIAGSQSGYLTDCRNYGQIYGRKEVGGIVGQMEPTVCVIFEEDTLQTLQSQVDTMGAMANQTVSEAQSDVAGVKSQIDRLQGQIQDARDALDTLVPDPENPTLPDADTVLAAQNVLSGSLSGMQGTLQTMVSQTTGAVNDLSSNVQTLTGQLNQISATLSTASENLGGSITDISDLDTPDDLNGKVSDCANLGDVLGDLNAGGIAGAMALENDLDPEDDLELSGRLSLNFEGELRVVILDCENTGTVTAKRQNVGGLVGLMSLGLVKESHNTGVVSAESANYVGGIAGRSSGYIRACAARAIVSGQTCVGGIAGSGAVVSDCKAMVRLDGAKEKQGAILGIREEEDQVERNLYLSVGIDLGGIDGISYEGIAQSMEEEDFFALEGLPRVFLYRRIYAVMEDGTRHIFSIRRGSRLTAWDVLPELPEKAGYTATWEGPEEEGIRFDAVYQAVYLPLESVIGSDLTGAGGLPVLLAQGTFGPDPTLTVEQNAEVPEVQGRETVLGAWRFTLPEDGRDITLRALAEGEEERLRVMVLGGDGTWRDVEAQTNGSYLVFALRTGDMGYCLISMGPDNRPLLWLTAGATVMVLLVVTVLLRKRGKGKKQIITDATEEMS